MGPTTHENCAGSTKWPTRGKDTRGRGKYAVPNANHVWKQVEPCGGNVLHSFPHAWAGRVLGSSCGGQKQEFNHRACALKSKQISWNSRGNVGVGILDQNVIVFPPRHLHYFPKHQKYLPTKSSWFWKTTIFTVDSPWLCTHPFTTFYGFSNCKGWHSRGFSIGSSKKNTIEKESRVTQRNVNTNWKPVETSKLNDELSEQ